MDIQRILIAIHLEANARPAPFVDHAGILRDSKTGRAISGHADDDPEHEVDDALMREPHFYFACVKAAKSNIVQRVIRSLTAETFSCSVAERKLRIRMLVSATVLCYYFVSGFTSFLGKILQLAEY